MTPALLVVGCQAMEFVPAAMLGVPTKPRRVRSGPNSWQAARENPSPPGLSQRQRRHEEPPQSSTDQRRLAPQGLPKPEAVHFVHAVERAVFAAVQANRDNLDSAQPMSRRNHRRLEVPHHGSTAMCAGSLGAELLIS
ncbi:hypothetical protein [Spirillospora sp. CA-294931]|uniref:hypothetical protein n=1 Tax=Spirillospora sp. CA-294931 TaxID=3240042 RepID=UPI003D9294CD